MENLIFLAAGFISASLLAIIAVIIAWYRAVKLTERRMSGKTSEDGHSLSLAEMKVSLQRQSEDIQRLFENEAILEDHAKSRAAEIQSLTDNLRDLHTHYETARRDADEQRRHVRELETVLRDELHRQEELEPKLKKLGDEVTRLASQLRRPQTRLRAASSPQAMEASPGAARQPLKVVSTTDETPARREERPLDERIRALQAGVTTN